MKNLELKFEIGDEAYLIDEEEVRLIKSTYYRIFKATVKSIEIYEDKIEYLLKDKSTDFGFRLEANKLFKTRSELMVEIERRLNNEESFN